ncbi:MAG: RHS repeat-associated core domain-containing protein [Rhizomicrobium sp.]|nr:RHS repeat-associated core domain-containing protein [Rhizomicrobium sp.]
MSRQTDEAGDAPKRNAARAIWCIAAVFGLSYLSGPVWADTLTRSSSFSYDANTGLLTSEVIQPNDSNYRVETDYGYDGYGHRTTAAVSGQGIATRNTTAGFDGQGQFQTSATNALQQSESWAYDSRTGLPLYHTDLNGLVTSWSYDGFGRVTQEIRPDGGKTVYTYIDCTTTSCSVSGAAFAASMIAYGPDGSTVTSPSSTVYYDILSRQIGVETAGFDGSTIRALTQYDGNGNVHQTSRPYLASGGTPKWTVNTNDALGRVTRNDTPNSGYAVYAYHGLTVTGTNDKGQTTTTTKNAQGQVASVVDAANNTTSYGYNAYNNLTSVTNPNGNQITNSYDALGRKTASNDPDMGGWTYSYDVLGQMITQTDAKGQTTTLAYDVVGRVTTRSENGQVSFWTYGSSATFSGSNRNIGKLVEAKACTDGGCSVVISDRTISYDGYGRPVQSGLTVDGINHTFTTGYESNGGRPSTIAYPSGFTTQYIYNANGYLNQVKDPNSPQAYWTANARDAELHLISQAAGNGIGTTQYFDANTGLMTNIRSGPGDGVAAFDYQYDTLGNLTYRSDNLQSIFEYACYDALNRLTEYAVGNSVSACSSGQNHKTVGYDALGNVITKSGLGSYSYGSRPHAVASISGTVNGVANPSYSYDANGNMTTGAGRTIAYTSFNMTASIQQGSATIALNYDSEHARIKMTGPSGATYYLNDPVSGAMAEKQVSGSSTTWHDYIQADGRIVAEKLSGATTAMRYFVLDHLGSVAVITDEMGSVPQGAREAYDAWGKRRNPDGSDDTSCSLTSQTTRGFTGHEQIDAACLINANARIYDPALGRFMSADSMVPDPYDGQSYNRYTYVRNRPLSATDPTGHDDDAWAGWTKSGVYAQEDYLSSIMGLFSIGISTSPADFEAHTSANFSTGFATEVRAAISGNSASNSKINIPQLVSVPIVAHTNADGSNSYANAYVVGMTDSDGLLHMAPLGSPIFGGGDIKSAIEQGYFGGTNGGFFFSRAQGDLFGGKEIPAADRKKIIDAAIAKYQNTPGHAHEIFFNDSDTYIIKNATGDQLTFSTLDEASARIKWYHDEHGEVWIHAGGYTKTPFTWLYAAAAYPLSYFDGFNINSNLSTLFIIWHEVGHSLLPGGGGCIGLTENAETCASSFANSHVH